MGEALVSRRGGDSFPSKFYKATLSSIGYQKAIFDVSGIPDGYYTCVCHYVQSGVASTMTGIIKIVNGAPVTMTNSYGVGIDGTNAQTQCICSATNGLLYMQGVNSKITSVEYCILIPA